MGFFERAQAGYEQLAGKADEVWDRTGPRQVGDVDVLLRDLGLLAYLGATGRPYDAAARERVLGTLRAMEERGAIRDHVLHSDGRPAGGPGGSAGSGPPTPPRPGGSDGVATPPPERAGRHGDFLTQTRPTRPPGPPSHSAPPSGPDGDTSPPSTWGV